jgi:NADH-quinone oxidoreductase subunit F
MGKAKFVHVIDQRKCTQCDQCRTACPEGAIVRAGAKKPKTPPRPIPVRRK